MQAHVNVAIRLPDRPGVEIEFVIDTGFAGALALPAAAIEMLGLPYLQEMVANLANDDSVKADVHVATNRVRAGGLCAFSSRDFSPWGI